MKVLKFTTEISQFEIFMSFCWFFLISSQINLFLSVKLNDEC